MKLYELTNDIRSFMEAVEAGEIPAEAIDDTLESLDMIYEDKAENIACLIKELEAEAAAIKAEAANLTERAKAKANHAENLKKYLSNSMMTLGKNKIETSRCKLSFRKGETVVVDETFLAWAAAEQDNLLTFKIPEPNKTAIKAFIKNGGEAVGAHIESTMNLQVK